jgi:hypothetical protein
MVAPLVGSFQPKAITGGATFHNTVRADQSSRPSLRSAAGVGRSTRALGANLIVETDMSKAKEDSEMLLNAVLPFAEQMLSGYGEFIPYGGAMKPSGEIVSVAGFDGDEHPPSENIIHLLKRSFQDCAKSRQYKATAIVYDVRVILPGSNVKSDAVAIALDHEEKYSIVVLFPYKIESGKVEFGHAISQRGENDIFVE